MVLILMNRMGTVLSEDVQEVWISELSKCWGGSDTNGFFAAHKISSAHCFSSRIKPIMVLLLYNSFNNLCFSCCGV